jgi:hypothetical protein
MFWTVVGALLFVFVVLPAVCTVLYGWFTMARIFWTGGQS